MELIGVDERNVVSPGIKWPVRKTVTADKEAIQSPDKENSVPLLSPNTKKVLVDHQEAVKAVADRLMAFLDAAQYSLEFIPNRKNGRVTIRVLNSAGQVIRQIPPEELERISVQAGSGTGLLVDQKLG
jgi:uncharacterized FlaG/YvyC family protein